MLDFTTHSENDAIIRRAHELRAEALSNMLRAMVAFFRRKPSAQTRVA
jgi:hypothetical protein